MQEEKIIEWIRQNNVKEVGNALLPDGKRALNKADLGF